MSLDEVYWIASVFVASAVGGAIKYQVNGSTEFKFERYLFLILYSGMVGFGIVSIIDYFVDELTLKTCLGFSAVIGLFGPEQLDIIKSIAHGLKSVIDAITKRIVSTVNPKAKK